MTNAYYFWSVPLHLFFLLSPDVPEAKLSAVEGFYQHAG